MRKFNYEKADSFEAASDLIKDGSAVVMAGGTDILGGIKHDILKENPGKLVAIKGIKGSDEIRLEGDVIKIGATATLTSIVENKMINEKAPILAEAAHSVATPLIRNMGTIGGNLCQDVRCWFYRYPHEIGGRLECMRKGGDQCYAIRGDNRYHSIFGGMHVGITPCQAACPAGTYIPAYMEKIRSGNMDEAAAIFMQYNPMPMMTSRICPHPCQDKCNQCEHGDPVNIHGVERSIGDYILEHADRFYKAPEKETGKKVAVVGAGPGGLTAAYYLRKAGNEVVVHDMMEKTGGVLRYGIPHYRLPKTLVDQYTDALSNMGVKFKLGVKLGVDFSIDDLDKEYDAVYLSTGAWRQPMLGLDGENLTQFGLYFLKDVNTYLKKTIGEEILVCGGGNVAMDVALTAVRLGAKKVRLVCLESRDTMPASEEEILRAEEEGVEIYGGWGLGKVLTDKDGKVCGLEAMKCTSVRDEVGRFSPKYDYDDKRVFESDYIILATGQGVDVSFLGDKFADQLKTERGLLNADAETGKSLNPKIYAGGDAVTGPNIAIRAIRTGRNAARNICADFGLNSKEITEQNGFIHADYEAVNAENKTPQAELPIEKRNLTDEDTASYTSGELSREAGRCMNCGCYSVNASDLSPVLIVLGADIITIKRRIAAKDFFTTQLKAYEMLDPDEIIVEIEIPVPDADVMHYDKFRLRNSVDFAMISLASSLKLSEGKISEAGLVLGGVAPVPVEASEAEDFLMGKEPTEKNADEAAAIALKDAVPFEKNKYKVQVAKTFIKEAVLRLNQG